MIYIVRHGETDWNKEKRYAGRKDIPLNKTGINQAKEIKKSLNNIKFDIVISSPLKRAYDTAKIITDLDIITDERIIERCNGKLEGKLKSEIKQYIDFNSDETEFGIEKISDFKNRIFNFCKEIENNYKNKNVLVVTHAGVAIYMRCYFEGEPKNNDYSLYKLNNCEIIKYNN